MNTHTNRKPSSDEGGVPSGQETFKFLASVALIAIGGLAVFWTLVVRKFGTVGSRTLWFDLCVGYIIAIVMSHGLFPDAVLFRGLWVLLPILYVAHLATTIAQSKHVYRYSVGEPRFLKGLKGEAIEDLLAFVMMLIFASCGYSIFAGFVALSALAHGLRDLLIRARDRQRSAQMQDAMWSQQYAMDNFVRHNKGRI